MSDAYAAIADLYDFVGPYRERADIGFFVEAAKEARGAVLELGAGTGRVLIPTARWGIDIVGLDASAAMLDVCRRRLDEEPESVRKHVTLVLGDMRQFDLGQQFALITIPFRPFQHLVTVTDQLACLACVKKHLATGGTFVLDLFNPSLDALANRPIGKEVDDTPEFVVPDGRRVRRRARIAAHDRARQVNEVELIYYVTHPDGREERLVHAFPMRYLFRYEVEHLLSRAGFAVKHVYGGYDKSPFGADPGELIVVAT